MTVPSLHEEAMQGAQRRAIEVAASKLYGDLGPQSVLAALVKHGGMYTLLDTDLMTARLSAPGMDQLASAMAPAAARRVQAIPPRDFALKLRTVASDGFYKLVDRRGYVIHSELMAYLTEPGEKNGVTYDEGEEPSPSIPAAFTFAGQFIDHDLTFNGMNLTVNEQGDVVADDATPVIDLDSVYGSRKDGPPSDKIIDLNSATFWLVAGKDLAGTTYYDVPRHPDPTNPGAELAYIFDPRNDENQLILQFHILVERLHNKIRYDPKFYGGMVYGTPEALIDAIRHEVVAIWQSFVLNDYMPKIIRPEVLDQVLAEIRKPGYGNLKHKPSRDPDTGRNVVRMPHEFAIGFRFGHSQLRPVYRLNANNVALLFKDARHSDTVEIVESDGTTIKVTGQDDLRGGRMLQPEHAIDWAYFYPDPLTQGAKSMLIDHKVTARVFNLPESAIPDDIKYIGNLPHRNLIRSSQIGVVSGEELADFYGIPRLTQDEILGEDNRKAAADLFCLDPDPDGLAPKFKTPLWYYILKEAEVQSQGGMLGMVGSRLVAEVLAVAIYCGDHYPYNDSWKSKVINTGSSSNAITLRDIITYVES